jgi:adenosine deaminase
MKVTLLVAILLLICRSRADVTSLYKSLNKGRDNKEKSKGTTNNSKLTNADSASAIDDVIAMMPKIELHAHLHGSIRRSTLESLAQEKNISLNCDYNLDIDQCFGLFKVVHQIISSQTVLTRVFSEKMEDYMNDNVIYLEIRTTPRSLPDGTNDRQYIALLKSLISKHNDMYGSHKMLVKLILSIDRSKSVSYAMETLQIVNSIGLYPSQQHQQQQQDAKLIVGLDFSGNPLGGRFEDFAQIFIQGREMGLKITVHCAEIKQLSYASFEKGQKIHAFDTDETTFILSFK